MNLEQLRKQIDEIDKKLFELLQQRLQIVHQVGEFKKSQGSSKYIIRPAREADKVRDAYKLARKAGNDEVISKAMATLWRNIISLSINHEEPARISYDSYNDNLFWRAREYMGAYSGFVECESDVASLKTLTAGKSNVAAFEVSEKPKSSPWWHELAGQEGYSVFAAIPLFPSKECPLSVLVSNVTPEASGNDKFLYVLSGKLPADEKDSFEVLSEFNGSYLVSSDEFYNNYQSKLKARYIGCFAVLGI